MTPLEFDKYEGLGNDFIVVEAPEPLPVEAVTRLCDRHFGIGADGVLVVTPPRTPGARATMIVQNADGSRPEMCGNGLRCVALHLARKDGVERTDYVVDTDAGRKPCTVERSGDEANVSIDMGRAVPGGVERVESDGKILAFERVSMGNPHAITFSGIPSLSLVDSLGSRISAETPGGTNVEFVAERGPRSFDLVVWERGVGRTLACGTGACATAAALALAGRAPFATPIEIHLPGGPLEISVTEGTLDVRMRGPARRVFAGRL
ncbi:MAG TPA: diaminopimelate epimerase [Polyangiaceae bacterium]|nr:diaminopimelate epimerase [Polyangiaceae bacterium]